MGKNTLFPEDKYIQRFVTWIIKSAKANMQKINTRLKRVHNIWDAIILCVEVFASTPLYMAESMDWFIKKTIWFADQLNNDKILRRRFMFLIKGLSGLVFSALTIWLAYLEFGENLFKENVFWMLILGWSYIGFFIFLSRWDDLAKKNTEDKIDELINTVNELAITSKDTQTSINTLINEIRQKRN